MGRVSNFKEVTPLGLMRTPPPGTQFKTPSASGPSLPTSPTKDGTLESPLEFPFKKPGVSGPSLPTSPTKETIPESPAEFPLKRPSISGPSLPASPVKETVPGSPSAFAKKSSISGDPAITDRESKVKETVPESPSGFPFKKSSISGSSLHRNSVTEPPAEFPFKKTSVSGSPFHRNSTTEPPAEFPFKKPSVSGSSYQRNSTADPPAEFPFKKPSVSRSSVAGSLGGKPGVSSASPHRDSASETPADVSPETLNVSSPSVAETPEEKPEETVPESPSTLDIPDSAHTNKEAPDSPSHAEEALNTELSAAPVEESEPVSLTVETETQEQQASTEPEVTSESQSTPTRREPPDSLSPKPNFSISTSSRGLISPKAKAPQSPVIDFRANLKKREVVKDTEDEKEPEFKNVFGRLKKTETRNYVAPDALKGNILRGKAALNTTGGPKKTERVDEFRKSLVLRKDEMKAGGGSIRRNTAGEKDAPKPADNVPEAIAMRQNMVRANSIKQNPVDEPISPAKSFGSRASQDRPPFSPPGSSFRDIGSSPTSQEQPPSSPFRAHDEPGWPLRDTVSPQPSQELQPLSPSSVNDTVDDSVDEPLDDPSDHVIDEKPEDTSTATSDVLQAAGPEVESSVNQENTREAVEPIESSTTKPQAPSVKTLRPVRAWPPAPAAEATVAPTAVAKGKLAGRINPALVGLLSRGPPPPEGPKKELPTPVSAQSDSASPSAPLTHMTKGRARGPKRRVPQATEVSSTSTQDDTKEVGAIPYSEATPLHTSPTPDESPDANPARLLQLDENSVPDTEEPRPDSPIIAPSLEVATPSQDTPERDDPQDQFPQTPKPSSQTTNFEIFPSPTSEEAPQALETPREVIASDGPPVPPKSEPPSFPSPPTAKPTWSQQSRLGSPSPSPLLTSHKENQMEPASQEKSIPGVTIESARSSFARPLSQASPPVPPKDDDEMLDKPIDPRRLSRKMSAPSLVAQASEAREVISGFFKTFPNPRDRMDIDPQLMLMRKPDDVKIRTVKRQIWELTGDGRRQELPSHQEYILYQGSMYLCVHTFEIGRSNASEVYLWRGDDVFESSVDDEQPFARKVARENSAKLQIIRQGKEPTRFIQALGGIMITRRGSSSRHNSSALYMLCGRKHLGEMTFDEVDYSLRNLCSGFPYVVSAPFGKLYLWKGKGSGPEETGAARLIGMDLGLTGEFEEVTEGEEPEDFFDVFAGPREPAPHMCQDHWQLKPKYNHFRTRLLRVDHELNQPTRFWNIRRPGSGSPVVKANDCVQEIEPFCYRDITEKDVYVLDTFFEIYV